MGARLLIQSIDGRRVEEELPYPFDQARVLLGRGHSADVRLPHRTVSERHASIEQHMGHYRLTDHGSTNGTHVAGAKIVAHRGTRLHDGDLIELGIYVLSFHDEMLVTAPLTAERTAELAKRLLREQNSEFEPPAASPRLVVVSGPLSGQSYDLPAPPCAWLIGKSATCQLVLDDGTLADAHVELVRDLDGVQLRSLDAQHPARFGARQTSEGRLKDGDEITVGETILLFEDPADVQLSALMADGEDEALRVRKAPAQRQADVSSHLHEPATGGRQAERIGGPGDPLEAAPDRTDEGPRPQPAPPSTERPPRPRLGADLMVYGLAGLVLVMSIAGLVILLQSS